MFLFVVVVSLALGEMVLRLAGFSYPRFFVRDAVTGSWHNSGIEGQWRTENRTWVRINSDGLRDVEHIVAKPAGVFRIAILGDSYAEAMQVELEQTFWYILQTELNRCGVFAPKRVEIINFGVSGFGTAQELLALQHRAWKYSPDLVLLAFLTGNDIRNNSKALEPEKEIPFFRMEGGKLALDDSFRESEGFRRGTSIGARSRDVMTRHSRLAQAMEMAKEIIRNKESAGAQTSKYPGLESGLPVEVYSHPSDQAWADAWVVTEALLLAMRDDVDRHGAQFMVATLSNGIQVRPDEAVRLAFQRGAGVKDVFYPDHRISDFLRGNDVDVITLAPQMLEEARRAGRYLHGFPGRPAGEGHWNAHGHRIAGELIGRRLCQSTSRGRSGH